MRALPERDTCVTHPAAPAAAEALQFPGCPRHAFCCQVSSRFPRDSGMPYGTVLTLIFKTSALTFYFLDRPRAVLST